MTRGRKPLPDKLKLLRGTAEPRNMHPDQPQADADQLQFIPDELSPEAQKHWAKLRPLLVDAGIANNLDRMALIQLCEAWATLLQVQGDMRKTGLLVRGANNIPVRTPLWAMVNSAEKNVTRLLAEFGMTPSSRTRVKGEGRKPVRGGAFDDV